MSFAKRSLGKRKRSKAVVSYVGIDKVPPTSVYVERTFSKASFVLTKLRNKLYPITSEALMFLKENWGLVTMGDVAEILKKKIE